ARDRRRGCAVGRDLYRRRPARSVHSLARRGGGARTALSLRTRAPRPATDRDRALVRRGGDPCRGVARGCVDAPNACAAGGGPAAPPRRCCRAGACRPAVSDGTSRVFGVRTRAAPAGLTRPSNERRNTLHRFGVFIV